MSETLATRHRAIGWLSLPLPQSRHFAAIKNAALVFGIRVVGAGLTYASTVFLARWLGAHNFGVYTYIVVWVALLGLAFSSGFFSSAMRFVASYLAQERLAELAGFLKLSHVTAFLVAVTGSLIGLGLVLGFRGSIDADSFTALLIGLACIPLWTLQSQTEATARAFGWVNVAYMPSYILRSMLIMGFAGAVALFSGSLTTSSAMLCFGGAVTTALLVQGSLVFWKARSRLVGVRPVLHQSLWIKTSIGFLAIDGLRMLLDNTDILMIGQLLDPTSVAIYYAAIRTGGIVAFVSFSVLAVAVPKFVQIHNAGTREELQEFVSRTIQIMLWPSLGVAAVLAATGPYVLSLFGAEFYSGYTTLLVILGGLVLRAATGPVEYLLSVTGRHNDTIRIYAVTAVVNILLNLVLIPRLGILGAAISTYVAMIGGNLGLCYLVRKYLGVNVLLFARRRAK